MDAAPREFHLTDGRARLRWLIRLRWLALAGVSLAAALAGAGLVPGVNVGLVAAAVLLGVLTNVVLTRRSRRDTETDARHVGQALLDTGALTLVIWAAGGADCPFVGFYAFPMLLAALLGDLPALLPTGIATAAGLSFQVAATLSPTLAAGRWDPAPRWGAALAWAAATLTVGGVAYFAKVFSESLRAQDRARRDADTLLRLSLEGLDVGLEVTEGAAVVWQNAEAVALMGARVGGPWICPVCAVAGGPGSCSCGLLGPGPGLGPRSFARPLRPLRPEHPQATRAPSPGARSQAGERLFEMLALPLSQRALPRTMLLYLDRTHAILAQRHLVFTERLASLGRTVQGVAHELNTPLSTIKTLSRDAADVLAAGGPASPGEREDLLDSARLVDSEIDRCRRITHALLGRAETLATGATRTPLRDAVERAVSVVFAHERQRLRVDVATDAGTVFVPLDAVVQVLVNLLQNARDAHPEATDGEVELVARREASWVEVRIIDRGPGLTTEAAAHLFEPFFTTKPPGQGTGLGLYTSYALAQGIGGRLRVENAPEGGAVATFSLPADGGPNGPSSSAPAFP